MKKILFVTPWIVIFVLLSMIYVNADLGNFKVNSVVPIRVLANCTSINLTEVTNNNRTFIINTPMTYLGGQTFIYNFSNTSTIDTYSFSWNNPCVDCSNSNCGNSFSITSSGNNGVNNLVFVLFLIIIVYTVTLIGFFKKDATITAIMGMFMIALGVYLWSNGIIIYQDWITQYFALATIGLGAFFSIFASLSIYEDE